MKNDERNITFYDLDLYTKSNARSVTHKMRSIRSLNEYIGDLEFVRESKRALKKVGKDSRLVYCLEDIREETNHWILMVNLVDSTLAHPVTNTLDGTATNRETIKLDNKGLESSTHIVITKTPDSKTGKHLTLIEFNGVSSSKISAFLNHLSKIASKIRPEFFSKNHPTGVKGQKMRLESVVDLYAHPSDEFGQELTEGKLNDIRLVSDSPIVAKGFDINKHPELLFSEIKVSVKNKEVAIKGGNVGYLKHAVGLAKALDYTFVRVQFTDNSKASHTAILNADSGKLFQEENYVKKRKITDFGKTLTKAFPLIHDGIAKKMIALI